MNRFAAQPYPGARPFQRRDRDRFFGRAAEADTWWTCGGQII